MTIILLMKKYSILLVGMACFMLVSCYRSDSGLCLNLGAYYKIDTTDISLVEQNLVILDSLLLDEHNSANYKSTFFRNAGQKSPFSSKIHPKIHLFIPKYLP